MDIDHEIEKHKVCSLYLVSHMLIRYCTVCVYSRCVCVCVQGYVGWVRPMVRDTVYYLHAAVEEGKKVVVEGANATMLDIDFGESTLHSNTTSGRGIRQCQWYGYQTVLVVWVSDGASGMGIRRCQWYGYQTV